MRQPEFIHASADGSEVEIMLYGEIMPYYFSSESFAEAVARHKNAKRIVVRVNSPGGSVLQGLAMFNVLQAAEPEVVMRVEGIAASMASALLMSADRVEICKNARIMIHKPSGYARGKAVDLREVADLLDSFEATMKETYKEKTGASDETLTAWMDGDNWFTAQEAVDAKLADAIVPARIKNQVPATAFHESPEKIAALFAAESNPSTPEKRPMEKIVAAFGLSADATQEQVVAALKAKLAEAAKQAEAAQAELEAFKGETAQTQAEEFVARMADAGRVAPSQKDALLKMALTDLEAAKEFMEAQPAVKTISQSLREQGADGDALAEFRGKTLNQMMEDGSFERLYAADEDGAKRFRANAIADKTGSLTF